MMEINDRQMRSGYFAQHAALTLRLQMGDDIDFEMVIKPLEKSAEKFKTVRVLCDKKVNK